MHGSIGPVVAAPSCTRPGRGDPVARGGSPWARIAQRIGQPHLLAVVAMQWFASFVAAKSNFPAKHLSRGGFPAKSGSQAVVRPPLSAASGTSMRCA